MSDYTKDAYLRIADLGSAIKLNSATDTTSFQIGTPGYMAPEILRGKPYSFSVDIWSIGALMFVLLTAQLPFWDNNRRERRRRVCKEALDLEADPIASQLTPEAKDLLRGMLTKPVNQRLTIDQVLEHPWLLEKSVDGGANNLQIYPEVNGQASSVEL